ncbi:MAG: MarR family transcriptional regulator [Dehalococcoidia bacterium]
MATVPSLSRDFDQKDFPPPTVGALTRLAWQAFRERTYAAVLGAGFNDLQPAHVLLFRYPTIADMRPKELAEQMGISKQAMNDLLRQVEAKGYVELRADPSDGRARLITLTDSGSELMEHVRAAAHEISEEWAQAVGRSRFDAFHKTLLRLVDAANGTQLRPTRI